MDDLDLMSRPVNYISYQVESADGKAHDVQLYLEATSAWATNVPGQAVESAVILKPEGLQYAMTGTVDQPVRSAPRSGPPTGEPHPSYGSGGRG